MREKSILKSFKIDDPLDIQHQAGIEVTVTLITGERRWCLFMTPESLGQCGDWIDGTKIFFHSGAAHMIVVAVQLDLEIIKSALGTIDDEGRLKECTIPLE